MKKSSIFGLIVIAIAIAVILVVFNKRSSYASFTEAKNADGDLRVIGYLDKGKQLYYDAAKDANYFAFYVKDKDSVECKVVYVGTEPQDFEKSEQIVLTGRMAGNEFHASEILMKCPSKYTKDKLDTREYKAKSATL